MKYRTKLYLLLLGLPLVAVLLSVGWLYWEAGRLLSQDPDELSRFHLFAGLVLGTTFAAALVAAKFLSSAMSESFNQIADGLYQIERGHLKTRIRLASRDEFSNLAEAINKMAKGLEEHERVKQNFVRYVSKHVLEQILASDMSSLSKGERRKITVLFSDLREFTKMAEKLPPEEVVSLLNEYLAEMLKVIFRHNGTLDKFMGDGLMAEFGAPLEDEQQETHAVQAAIDMHRALEKLNAKWVQKGRPTLRMGIGIHTGLAIVGNIGSEKRMEYTAIGDTVNVAARLEQATKELDLPILLSESTREKADPSFHFRSIGTLVLEGRSQPIAGYTVRS